jgi:ABC-type transport system substrate-binding protein
MADLATSEFALHPVGTGPYQLIQLNETHALLVPSAVTQAGAVSSAPPVAGSASPGGSGEPGSAAPSGTSAASASATPTPTNARSSASPSASAKTASPTPSPSPTPSATPSPTAAADPNAQPIQQIEMDFFDSENALAAAFTAGQIDGASGLSAGTTAALGATAGARVLDYPTTTLSAVLLNLRPTHPELQNASVRKALLSAIDRATIATSDLGGQARVADTLIPPESWAYDPARVVKIPFSRSEAAKLLRSAGWTSKNGKWTAPKGKSPYAIDLLTVPASDNPRLAAIASAVRDDWTALGMTVTVTSLSGSSLAARLQSGSFTAAVLDIASGLEPDLYPLLDSSQVRSNGSNRSGYQDPALDKLLEAARQNGTQAQRKAAWSALLAGISAKMPVLPLVWEDEQAVVRGLSGATQRLIVNPGDRFWDVLAWRLAAAR